MSDRAFTISFSVSLGLHLALLIGQLFSLDWFSVARARRPIDVVYEYEVAEQETRHLQVQLDRAKREVAAASLPGAIGAQTQIRIPDRPSLTTDHTLSDVMPDRASMVDLTNLVEAARGDPVLLSYFSAIREQIQQTANRRAWSLEEEAGYGLVYVSFMLSSTGDVQRVAVVADRSIPSQALRDIAVRIVKTAAPFPPFPPSMVDPQKTIVVPLEFLSGSQGG
jgi:TonB family protein